MDSLTPSEGAPGSPVGDPSTVDRDLAVALSSFDNFDYRDRFWPGRRYEDRCDRIALRALLPSHGDRLIEVGAGFGRLADEYLGYGEVILVDPSDAMLEGARAHVGDDPRYVIMSGDAQRLPLPDACADALVCVRVLHHIRDPRPAIGEFSRVLRPGGILVLEAANKRNLKEVLAYLIHRQGASPIRRGSVPYVGVSLLPRRLSRSRRSDKAKARREPAPRWKTSTSYLHAPRDVDAWLLGAGFAIGRKRSVGLLRPPFVTGLVPVRVLVGLEHVLQPALAGLTAGPSLFVSAVRREASGDRAFLDGTGAED